MSNLSPTTIRLRSGLDFSESSTLPKVETSIAPIRTNISSVLSAENAQRTSALRVLMMSLRVALTRLTSRAELGCGMKNSPKSNTETSPCKTEFSSTMGIERRSFLSIAPIIEKHDESIPIRIKSVFMMSFVRRRTSPTNGGSCAPKRLSTLSMRAFELPQRAARKPPCPIARLKSAYAIAEQIESTSGFLCPMMYVMSSMQ